MISMADRRITRSISNELQARAAQLAVPMSSSSRGYLDEAVDPSPSPPPFLNRNSTEEMFLRLFMENNLPPTPTITPASLGLGTTIVTRGDSEELFRSWISNAEGQATSPVQSAFRARKDSRRASHDLAPHSIQQNCENLTRADSFEYFVQGNALLSSEMSGNDANKRQRMANENRDGDFSFLKHLVPQSQPMTRSRSSELRRRYAIIEQLQTPPMPMEDTHPEIPLQPIPPVEPIIPSGLPTSTRQSGSSTPTSFNALSTDLLSNQPGESVSAYVSMLKGSLERKKLTTDNHNKLQKTDMHSFNKRWTNQGDVSRSLAIPFQPTSQPRQQMEETDERQNGSFHIQECREGVPMEGGRIGNDRETGLCVASPSESSGGAPVVSTDKEPSCSGPVVSNRDDNPLTKRQSSFTKQVSSGNPAFQSDSLHKSNSNIERNRILTRMASVNSAQSAFSLDKEDLSKRRRVERQRKMAESKSRGSTGPIPPDLQSALKRCDALEKEVRSLKLNLSFMNRKDSEQTKHIEELESQNEELQKDKFRLMEELEHITSQMR